MKTLKYLLVLLTTTGGLLYSQNISYSRYLPLKVGNVWVYEEHYGYPYYFCYNYHKYRITGTTQIGGKTYFDVSVRTVFNLPVCEQSAPNLYSRLYENMHIRLDSVTGNIYTAENCGNTPGVILDSLSSKLGDSATICIGGTYLGREACTDTSIESVLGMNKPTKTFCIPHASGAECQSYAMGIGMYHSNWSESTSWWDETLKGCVINGVLYGDTSMIVGIGNLSKKIPDKFSLSQNYPNPFNPNTDIQFQVAKLSKVKLIVCNTIGREISTLVDEELQPGTYEVDWDGSNYPSGVYFYRLVAGDFTQTKKMVLVK